MVIELEKVDEKYKYYVPFMFGRVDGGWGFGSREVVRESPIETYEDVLSVASLIEGTPNPSPINGVTVLDWKRVS